jgi:hypothetical protein
MVSMTVERLHPLPRQRLPDPGLGHHAPHPRDALRGFRRHDVALSDHDIVVQQQPLRPQPFLQQVARGAEGDHAQEVVDERRVPAVQKRAFDPAVFGGERGGPGRIWIETAVRARRSSRS